MATLKNWAITRYPNRYRAPEACSYCFSGNVYDHPDFEDGHFVHTSKPTSLDMDGRKFRTYSGTEYELSGLPAAEWVSYLFNNGYSVQQYVIMLLDQM